MATTPAAKMPQQNGVAHTAGIYADMTVDGPEIGTLVVVIDRAKNLPNRKAMGKQDPYCAARLGKEAKKTETDRRGGQTPKWDQELRFTVHESPDYYQLKISVFNDDKKTELIGECWVALETLIVRGGAQNDTWHNLTCKGRFAGEIRIELTYYDTRPRDIKVDERRPSNQTNNGQESAREGLNGPRQPRQVKRRPLPADPTGATPPTSLPASPAAVQQSRGYVESPDDYQIYSQPQNTHSRREATPQNYTESYDEPPHMQSYPGQRPFGSADSTPSRDIYQQSQATMMDRASRQNSANDLRNHQQMIYSQDTYDDTPDNRHYSAYAPSPLALGPPQVTMPQPLRPTSQHSPHPPATSIQPYHRSSLSHSMSADVSPLSTRSNSHETWSHVDDFGQIDDVPAPPIHRMSGMRSDTQTMVQYQGSSPLSMPPSRAPQNYPSNPQYARNQGEYRMSMPNMASGSYGPPSASRHVSPQNSYNPLHHRRSQSPTRSYGQPMPSALVAGFDSSILADHSNRDAYDDRMQSQLPSSSPPKFLRQQASVAMALGRPQPISRGLDSSRGHRNSAPNLIPLGTSPDSRTPMRKSVSPQPESLHGSADHPTSTMFSPDSFDAFNPNLRHATEINAPSARYDTPERAQDAAQQHELDSRRPQGPIIGSDGRVIDPSDHLPTDTWAPEPEQKTPKRGPEVTLKFRHSTQALPQQGRRPLMEAKPNAATPPYQIHSAGHTPASGERTRLQKKNNHRMSPTHPASSPIVPTLNTTPQRSPLQHPVMTESEMRDREVYGNGYGHKPLPPPVPSKIPIGSGQEDWPKDALSEELSRIDIGVGNGHRSRTRRFGL